MPEGEIDSHQVPREVLDQRGKRAIERLRKEVTRLINQRPALRPVAYLLLTAVLIAAVWGVYSAFAEGQPASPWTPAAVTSTSAGTTSGQTPAVPHMSSFVLPEEALSRGIPRFTLLKTIIPARERVDVQPYEVQQGDSVFSIAEQFGLKPETVLWGNFTALQADPRNIYPGQTLNILPLDGVYHQYHSGESLTEIAREYRVKPDAILDWLGNHLDPYETDLQDPHIADGAWLIIPGGQGEYRDWGPPPISRANPASAAFYGAGHCGQVYKGAVGTNTFTWPTTSTQISGYRYDPNLHPAIDLGGLEGNAIYAVDHGVVVFAGPSNFGYGNLVVIDHGTGWQSAYAHLSGIFVSCGQSVSQGTVIAGLGNTGNSSGPHLHFELRSDIYGKVNPLNFLIQP